MTAKAAKDSDGLRSLNHVAEALVGKRFRGTALGFP